MDANEEKKTDEKREQKLHSAFGWRQNVHWISISLNWTIAVQDCGDVCTFFETGKPWKFLRHNFDFEITPPLWSVSVCVSVCELCMCENCRLEFYPTESVST